MVVSNPLHPFRRRNRLRRPSDIQRVLKTGRRGRGPWLHCWAAPGSAPASRVAFQTIAATRLGGAARNYRRRLLREAYRRLGPSLPSGWDIVILWKDATTLHPLHEVEAELSRLLNQATRDR